MSRTTIIEAILVLTVAPLVIYMIWGGEHWLWVALFIGAIGLLWPWAASKIAWAWHQLAHILGRVNGTLLLSIVFLLLVWPIGLLAKIFRRDDRLQLRKETKSYFQQRDHTFTSSDLEDPW